MTEPSNMPRAPVQMHVPPATPLIRPEWSSARRVVIKVGSALLTDAASGSLKRDWVASLMDDIAMLKRRGIEVVLVSSGAVALGRGLLELHPGVLSLEESQAAAAAGQISLAHAYQEFAQARDLKVAQILVTTDDTEQRRRYLNARQTIKMLLGLGALPVVNENDTVATSEIRYGDNDRLSARVASMVSADCLVLLSDIDGLYNAPPATNADAKRLDVVRELTPEIIAMAGDAGSGLSRGGMKTKREAARVAMSAGCHMLIASGVEPGPITRIEAGAPCTWFLAPSDPVTAKKRWISGQLVPLGRVVVDEGARKALMAGKSLLPAGVIRVSGSFDRGDAVVVVDEGGEELARGLINYSDADAKRIMGKHSREIAGILGFEGRSVLIHRDDMAVRRS